MHIRSIAGVLAALTLCHPAAAAEKIVSIPGGKAPLFGTLETPVGKPATGAAVLIIAGSGPTDRDGNSDIGPSPNELKQLADALTRAGIVSLRIDKRGAGASAAAAPPESELRITTYAGDAAAWADWLKTQPGVRCVVIAGHSEGSLVAILAAEKSATCGVASLEGAGRPLSAVLHDQLQGTLQEPLRARAFAVLDSLAAGKAVADPPPELRALFRPSVQAFLMSELTIDPAVEVKKIKAPMLLTHGDADEKVTLADYQGLRAARPDAQTLEVPGMVHPLKVPGGVGLPKNLTNLPLAPGVAEAVIRFVKSAPRP